MHIKNEPFILQLVYLFSSQSFLSSQMIGDSLGSLYPVFINIMFAFTAKNNKHIQKFNQKHAEKKKLVK